MQMTIDLDLTIPDQGAVRSEIFGVGNSEVILPDDIVLADPEGRSGSWNFEVGSESAGERSAEGVLAALQLVASIPAGVLTNLATEQIRRYLENRNTVGHIRNITIRYIDNAGTEVTKIIEFDSYSG